MVPTGTLRITSAPSRPVLLEPSPWRPRSALYSGLKRKWTSVLWRSLDSMITSPPRPPSPPEGPPRGTYFSRRNAMQPLPPSPALTVILTSSTNKCTAGDLVAGVLFQQWLSLRLDADELAHAAAVSELDDAGDLGKQRVVLTPADVLA